eukprot:355022-Chlamydomonas_euryale.AAC.3
MVMRKGPHGALQQTGDADEAIRKGPAAQRCCREGEWTRSGLTTLIHECCVACVQEAGVVRSTLPRPLHKRSQPEGIAAEAVA